MIVFRRLGRNQIIPFNEAPETAMSRSGYLLWILPQRWHAACQTKENLAKAAAHVELAQHLLGGALICFLVLVLFIFKTKVVA